MENHHEHELKIEKEKDKKKDEKNFDNLSTTQQNILLLITTTENQTDEDLKELTLSPSMRACIEQTSSIKILAHIRPSKMQLDAEFCLSLTRMTQYVVVTLYCSEL